jgi:hypothetical protein
MCIGWALFSPPIWYKEGYWRHDMTHHKKRAKKEAFKFHASHFFVLIAVAAVLWLRLGYIHQQGNITSTPLMVAKPIIEINREPQEKKDFSDMEREHQNGYIANKLTDEKYKLDPESSFVRDYSSITDSHYSNNYSLTKDIPFTLNTKKK